jgi:hypothetical protein
VASMGVCGVGGVVGIAGIAGFGVGTGVDSVEGVVEL